MIWSLKIGKETSPEESRTIERRPREKMSEFRWSKKEDWNFLGSKSTVERKITLKKYFIDFLQKANFIWFCKENNFFYLLQPLLVWSVCTNFPKIWPYKMKWYFPFFSFQKWSFSSSWRSSFLFSTSSMPSLHHVWISIPMTPSCQTRLSADSLRYLLPLNASQMKHNFYFGIFILWLTCFVIADVPCWDAEN